MVLVKLAALDFHAPKTSVHVVQSLQINIFSISLAFKCRPLFIPWALLLSEAPGEVLQEDAATKRKWNAQIEIAKESDWPKFNIS